MKKSIVIFGGGTVSHVRSHLALCAPAYGGTARRISELCKEMIPEMDTKLYLTKMASQDSKIETNEDVEAKILEILPDHSVRVIFFSCAMCDFDGKILAKEKNGDRFQFEKSGKYSTRLKSDEFNLSPGSSVRSHQSNILITSKFKVINSIRHENFYGTVRKDIFLVGFKTTCGATEEEQYIAGLNLCKKSSCNLVLANDVKTRLNMIITPEEAKYHVTKDREDCLKNLVEMVKLRSSLNFTRSTVIKGDPVPWNSTEVPQVLRDVVDYCIKNNAYKPFNGATVGHFAAKLNETTFLTSRRKTNFNDLEKIGLVRIETDGPDRVIAYGAKPSVGGQSQRIVFAEHPDCDCIVHFHCPIKPDSKVPTVSQREYECGSHQCGTNTSRGLEKFGNLYAVYLDQHGPNIVFNKTIDPQEVINFIEDNFDLSQKTGGPVSLVENV